MEKKYVPSKVFVYSVWFQHYIRIPIYVKPFPEDYSLTEEQIDRQMRFHEDLIKSKYFTKERIEQLKEEFIKKIRDSGNPFTIDCVDIDSYNVDEEKLFDIT